MKFLARHNYVHRDIAARNCLGEEIFRCCDGDMYTVSFLSVIYNLSISSPKIFCLCSVSINLCAVGAGLCIKIADFGLARKINKSFKIEEGSVLPVRSMAPECFITGEFTTASDIW